MIDISTERLMPLTEARKHRALRNPRTRKPANASTIFRHAMYGARAVNGDRIKLESVKLPSGLCTSEEAIERFIARLTNPHIDTNPTPNTRQRDVDGAVAELAAAGMV